MEFWPHALKEMGSDAGAVLEMLHSHDYKFYVIRGKQETPLRARTPAELLSAHPLEQTGSQTDLMALRGRRQPPEE